MTAPSGQPTDAADRSGVELDDPTAEVLELRSALEEVRISREELAAQNDELLASRELIELERQRYRQLFELAPVGYLITDLAGVIREANRFAGELLGREVRFLVGKPLVALVPADRRSAFRALVREASAGARWHDELAFATPDGDEVELLVQAIGPGGGGEGGIRWSLAEPASGAAHRQHVDPDLAAAYRLQRHRLSELLDRLQHAVATVNRSLHVTYANSPAAELLRAGGDPVGAVLVDPWPEPSLCMLAARMFEPHAVPEEARVTLDESRRVYDILALPPDASGEALLVIADATSNARSQRAEREFVANAAHQLRTPVAAIASAIEVLQGGAKESPEARDRFLAHLDRQCTRLVRLTRALLILARAQALAEPPAMELVPLRPLLDGIARGLRPAAGVEVLLDCPFHLAALGDRDLLEQAVGNLAENAARHTVEGEVVLRAEPGSEGHVRLVISDTGPGGDFPADGRFQRFYRDPAAPGEGFGLGLAIAAEAMRVLGGELHMESTGRGTRATATLPAAMIKRR